VIAQLQVRIVLRRAIDLVPRADDGLAILDVFLVVRHPVGTGTFEVVEAAWPGPVKHADGMHGLFQSPFEFPLVIVWAVVRRDEDGHVGRLCRCEQALDVVHRALLGHAFANQRPMSRRPRTENQSAGRSRRERFGRVQYPCPPAAGLPFGRRENRPTREDRPLKCHRGIGSERASRRLLPSAFQGAGGLLIVRKPAKAVVGVDRHSGRNPCAVSSGPVV